MKSILSVFFLSLLPFVHSQMNDGKYTYLNEDILFELSIIEGGWEISSVKITDLKTGNSSEGSGTWFKVNMNGADDDYEGPGGWYQFTLNGCDYEFDAPSDPTVELLLSKYCADSDQSAEFSLWLNMEEGSETADDTEEYIEDEGSEFLVEKLLVLASETELTDIYGSENIVTEYSTEGPEGTEVEGYYYSTLYPGTDNEILIFWETEKEFISGVRVSSANSMWSTISGIKVGMTLEELVELNGVHVSFYGFGWDYGGLLSSFNEGLFENEGVYVIFCSENEEANINLSGDQEFHSNTPETQNAGIYVCEFGMSQM